MKLVDVEKISEDLILAREVTGKSGNVLLAKGTKLTVSMGHRLKNWGVQYAYVEGEDFTSEKNYVAIDPNAISDRLNIIFSQSLNSEIMKQIYKAVYEFKISHGAP